jgi:hypothetical protein
MPNGQKGKRRRREETVTGSLGICNHGFVSMQPLLDPDWGKIGSRLTAQFTVVEVNNKLYWMTRTMGGGVGTLNNCGEQANSTLLTENQFNRKKRKKVRIKIIE